MGEWEQCVSVGRSVCEVGIHRMFEVESGEIWWDGGGDFCNGQQAGRKGRGNTRGRGCQNGQFTVEMYGPSAVNVLVVNCQLSTVDWSLVSLHVGLTNRPRSDALIRYQLLATPLFFLQNMPGKVSGTVQYAFEFPPSPRHAHPWPPSFRGVDYYCIVQGETSAISFLLRSFDAPLRCQIQTNNNEQ